MNAVKFLLIFAAALVLYGLAMWKTGDIVLMPYHVTHSIGSPEDVRRVGLIVIRIGLILGAVLTVVLLLLCFPERT